ncbi:MAG TPA: hypothetical protein VKZ79_11410 [Alphaproteobacteria bacterium]|nr:hypothetical protein [Alphaproteobacteria bacterium]
MIQWTFPDPAALLELIPTWTQVAGLLAVLASGLVMLVLGRAMLGARTLPEVALVAGWGLISLVLTLWGVLTPENMRTPAVALIAVAAVAALLPRGRLAGSDLVALGRLIALALPLIAVFASAMPALPDTFTNQLPNAVYLYDYGRFPGIDRPPMLAVWPAFPYNLQLAAFIPALLAPDFPPAALTHVNLLLQLAFALLLARSMRGAEVGYGAPPSWYAVGGALLLTTFLNPGFDPKIQFSGYGDPAIAVAMAFAAWQSERLIAARAAGRSGDHERLALTFVLLAGVAIKQVSIFLVACIVGVSFLIAAFDRRIGPRRAIASFLPAFLPAMLLWGVWRMYVSRHFSPDAELTFLPPSQWNFAQLPQIIASMGQHIWERLPFFLLLYGVTLGAIPLTLRWHQTPVVRLFLLTAGMTILYTLFLAFTYVAHFPGGMGASAHSFFRYNLHLGLLATLAAVAIVHATWLERGAPDLGPSWQFLEAGAIVIALAAPVVASSWIRFDRREPQPLVWDLAKFAAHHMRDGDHVALLLPGDNNAVAYMLRVALAMTTPRHALSSFDAFPTADPQTLKIAAEKGDNYALISCTPPGMEADGGGGERIALPAGQASLLLNDGGKWRPIGSFRYPVDLPPTRAWTAQLPAAPFCR